jgi:hypothetical protein
MAFSNNHIARLSAMYEHISAICLQVTVVHYLKMSCEIVLFPRSLATTGICTYSRKSPGLYLAVEEPAMRIQNGFEELPE